MNKEKTTNVEKKTKQSFMAGVLTILIAQIIIKILGLVYRLVITNIPCFGDAGNGLYSAGYQIYTLLLAIASIGVPSAIAKLVSERIAVGKNREAHDIFKTALLLFGMIGLTGSCLLFFGAEYIATSLIGNPDVKGIMIALSPAVFFVAVAAVVRGYFNGMYNMKVTSNSQMIEQFFKSLLTIVLVVVVFNISINMPLRLCNVFGIDTSNYMSNEQELSNLISNELEVKNAVESEYKNSVTVLMATVANVASTVAAAIGLCYLFIYYKISRKRISKDINESKGEYKKEKKTKIMKMILAVSIPISMASIISAINRNIDTFTVMNGLKIALEGMYATEELIIAKATELYGILSGRVDTLIGLPTALNIAFSTALVPAVSEAMANKDEKTAKRRITFSFRTTLLIALPCAAGMFVLAEPILELLFPNVYAPEAGLLLKISSFTVIFTLLNQTIAGALQGLGKVSIPAIALGCGAIVKLVLNLTLIPNPQIGIFGAAISSVAASATATCIELVVLTKIIKFDNNFTQIVIKPMLCTLLMGAGSFASYNLITKYIIDGPIATLVSIVIAVLIYFLSVLFTKVFDREDYHMLPYGDKIYNFLKKIKLVQS